MKKFPILVLVFCVALTLSVYAKPKPVNSLIGIKLGDPSGQVMKVLGNKAFAYKSVITLDTRKVINAVTVILDDNNKVETIMVQAPAYIINIQGVKFGAGPADVRKVFGEPDIKTDKWGIVTWEYFKYNLLFSFEDDACNGVTVHDYSKDK
jgi:hypothetical protein